MDKSLKVAWSAALISGSVSMAPLVAAAQADNDTAEARLGTITITARKTDRKSVV